MNSINYRTIKKTDYPHIKSMINEAFGFHKFIQDSKTLEHVLSLYLHSCLNETTFSRIAEKEGKVIGVILGYTKNNTSHLASLSHLFPLAYHYLQLRFTSNQGDNPMQHFKKLTDTYTELLAPRKQDFQGSVTLFIVSPESRGLGVGKSLMKELLDHMTSQAIGQIYLYTDTICNYGFYDNQGFIRLDERQLAIPNANTPNEDFSLGIFLYGYTLTSSPS